MRDRALQIKPEWRPRLAKAGLDSFDALLHFEGGECVSHHTRGQTIRLLLPGGQTLYLRRIVRTLAKQIAADWLRFRRSQPLTVKEHRALLRVAAMGVDCAEPVAWGQRRRWAMAWQGVLVTTPLEGRPLDDYLTAEAEAARRRAALAAVGAALRTLYEAGLSWPDLVPKHVYVTDIARVGLLDLERLTPRRNALVRCMPGQVRRFCGLLRGGGADLADLDVLLDALGYEDLVDYSPSEGG